MLRKIALTVSIIMYAINFSGCDYTRQVNEMAYVVGMGLDKGEGDNVLLSLQFAKPMVVAGKGGGGGEEEETNQENKATSLVSAEGNDIFSAMSIIESSLSKQINLTHTKLLLFSDSLCREGILKYAEGLMGNNQFRPNTYTAVAYGGAKEYFEKVKPALELNPAKYYTLMFTKDTKSFMPECTLRDLYFSAGSNEASAVMPVVGTIEENQEENSGEPENFIAGKSTKKSENKTDSAGMAVFKGDKLAMVMPSDDAEIFNIITGKYQEGYFNILQNDGSEHISLRLKARRKPKIRVKTDGEKIEADVKISLSAEVLSYPKEKYSGYSELKAVICEDIIKKAEDFTNKSKELSCDAVGFGRHAKENFMTYPEWEEYKWEEKFPEISVNFEVETHTKGGNLVG